MCGAEDGFACCRVKYRNGNIHRPSPPGKQINGPTAQASAPSGAITLSGVLKETANLFVTLQCGDGICFSRCSGGDGTVVLRTVFHVVVVVRELVSHAVVTVMGPISHSISSYTDTLNSIRSNVLDFRKFCS